MAESTLSLTYDDLMQDIAIFLGITDAYSGWSAALKAKIDRFVQDGYRQFLYPPAFEGLPPDFIGYEWAFIRPIGTLITVEGVDAQDLPDDFGRLINGFTFEGNSQVPMVLADVGEGRIRELRMLSTTQGRPREAAVRIKPGTGLTGQRKEIAWDPIPDDSYTLSYKYEAYTGKLDASANLYPLGGMKHSATLLQSCRAVAEAQENDQATRHQESLFVRNLVASIKRDKKEGAKFFGPIGSGQYEDGTAHLSAGYSLSVSGIVIEP